MSHLASQGTIDATGVPKAALRVTVNDYPHRDSPYLSLNIEVSYHLGGGYFEQEAVLFLNPEQAEFIAGALGDAYTTAKNASNHRGVIEKAQVQ